MIELLSGGIFGSLIGGIFRIAPEILKFFDKKNERAHELKMFTLQTELEKMRGEFRMEERYVDHSVAALDAINSAFDQQGKADAKAWKWVASLSALVRPGVTFWFMALYSVTKMVAVWLAWQANQSIEMILAKAWGPEDFGLLSMILTFWFVGRAIEKYRA